MLKLKITILAALIATIAHPVFAEVTIYAGAKNGGYDAAARTIAKRLSQRGIDANVENRAGSDDITLQACNNGSSIWISQIDALYTRELKDGCFLPSLSLYGEEKAVILFPPKSKLDELDDLSEKHTVFVDKVGSGSELFWRTIQDIEAEHGRGSDWINASSETGDIRRLQALASRGKIHAAILVRKPNSADLAKLLKTGWAIGELYDRDINDLKYGDQPLYEGDKIRLEFDGKRYKGYGYTVRSFVGTTESVETNNPDLFDAILGSLE